MPRAKSMSFIFLSSSTFFSQQRITREDALKIVESDGCKLSELEDKYKADKEIVLLALKRCPLVLKFASQDLKKDKEVVSKAIKRDRSAFEFADESLKADREFVTEIRMELKYLNDSFRKDKGFVINAVNHSANDILFIDPTLLKDETFLKEILAKNGDVLEYIEKKYRANKEFVFSEFINIVEIASLDR